MNKKVLFNLLSESYNKILTEAVIYKSSKEIPEGIKSWVRNILEKNIASYRIDQSGEEVYIGEPINSYAKVYYQFFKLENGDAYPIGNTVDRKGWEGDSYQDFMAGQTKTGKVPIPDGTVLVQCEKSYNYTSVTIYTNKNAQLFMPLDIDENELSLTEVLILGAAKSLIASARPKFKSDEPYNNLIAKGYLRSNRSITDKGKNVLSEPKIQEKLKKAKDAYQRQTGKYASF